MEKKSKYLLLITILFQISNINYVWADSKKEVKVSDEKKEVETPLTQDLMSEHGILNRVLLIYEEIIRRIDNNDYPIKALGQSVAIIQDFIENHHERLEEDYIFPLFEKNKKKLNLVRTLRKQHESGRVITSQLKEIVNSKKKLDKVMKRNIKSLLKKFITMYRPHEAREDTVLFPMIRSLMSEKEFDELSEKFEALENEAFGPNGFSTILKKVENIEKELNIYQLDQFTPSLGK